jgi:hypothetical protein
MKRSKPNDFENNPMISGQWNVPSFIVYGRTKRNIHLLFFPFHQKKKISSSPFTIDYRAFLLT